MSRLLLRDVEVRGRRIDVSVRGGRIERAEPRLPVDRESDVIDGGGAALIPGLWDHHIHLLASAAARHSTVVGPPKVTGVSAFAAALRRAAGGVGAGQWIRAVGYHESVAGELDRTVLDDVVGHHPLRVQHRSGALWILNSEAVERLDLETADLDGIERDEAGRPTGRLYGADRWLRLRLPPAAPPDLRSVGRYLAGRGVVGVTDATPFDALDDLRPVASACVTGALPQQVVATGGPSLTSATFPAPLRRGPVKLVLADHDLPTLDAVVDRVVHAHSADRAVAVHCASRVALVLALAAWDVAGVRPGDRVEHGAVVPPELRSRLARGPLVVVTQPNFVEERGDAYLADVEADDVPYLYPCRSLLEAGIEVAGSTDAPFGDPDPWRAIGAAIDRRTAGRAVLGAGEAVSGERALDLFLGAPDAPGGPPREVRVGARADLALLSSPLGEVLSRPAEVEVAATIIDGQVVHGVPGPGWKPGSSEPRVPLTPSRGSR